MKYFYGACLLIAVTATSCKDQTTAANQGDPRLLVPFTQQTALQNNNAAVPSASSGDHNLFHGETNSGSTTVLSGINPAHGQPNHRCDIAVGAPLNSVANGSQTSETVTMNGSQQVVATSQAVSQPSVVKTDTAKGMNPPHGAKNHRCDIAVGAPLNSKAAAPVQTANYVVNQAGTATTTTAQGLNPAHGEKNHRCDIAVGAPLNSKPAEKVISSKGEVSKQVNVQAQLPALLSTNASDVVTADGINPAHGKEGHRCDIAVGAKLPKT